MDKCRIQQHNGDISILSAPHVLICYSDEIGADGWEPVAVLSVPLHVEDMRIQYLYDDIHPEIIDEIHNNLKFYLFEKQEHDPIGYLISVHVNMMANIYSLVHHLYVEQIHWNNIQHFINCAYKIKGCQCNSMSASLVENFTSIVAHYLGLKANDDPKCKQRSKNQPKSSIENHPLEVNDGLVHL